MLNEIKKNLNNQNNRATADPIYVVYDYEKVPSCEDYTDKFMFIDEEGFIANNREELYEWLKDVDYCKKIEEHIKDLDDEDFLQNLRSKGIDNIQKVFYIKKRIFINVFFTEHSAKKFIEQNHYHYTKEVHIYVNCLWRNPETQYIRNSLKNDLLIEK